MMNPDEINSSSDHEFMLRKAMKIGRMSPWEYSLETDSFITGGYINSLLGLEEYYKQGNLLTVEIIADKIHPEDREYFITAFRRSVTEGVGCELHFRINTEDGERYIYLISEVIKDIENVPLKITGIVQDLTRIRMLEESIKKQDEGLRFIAEKARIGLWEYNRSESRVYSITRDTNVAEPGSIYKNMIASDFLELIHEDDRENFRQKMINPSMRKGDVLDLKIRVKADREQFRWFHLIAVVDKVDDSGTPFSYKGLFHDINERKEIEDKLYQSQKMEAIGRLAGGIAHDFNNLLQVILGYGSLALMDAAENSEMLENINHIVDASEKAQNLVRQLLLFSRSEKIRSGPVNVNNLFSGFIKMVRRVIGENIELIFTPADDVEFINGDGGQLEQVLMNLCINARDAIQGSGRVTVKTKSVTIDNHWPCFESDIVPGRYIMLSVSDNGRGIPKDDFKHIFEPFFTTKGSRMGVGLGLASVYSIVKQHHGYIDVHSREDIGTTFNIYLPVYSGEENSLNSVEKKSEWSDESNRTILLAEDDELIRKYIKRILIDSGFNVIIADEGESAVSLFNEKRDLIDVLILDVVMPKKNGWDVYTEISSVRQNIPVLFISGYDQNLLPSAPDVNIPMKYVQKPFKYYTIMKAINDLLGGRGGEISQASLPTIS